mmetsp:Transcript_41827/g.65350  ORF Transcript_41827/g.65350 Transcript_41827/m.65350 type:complete len:110 (+) Transcript_41827:3348-3677(+)
MKVGTPTGISMVKPTAQKNVNGFVSGRGHQKPRSALSQWPSVPKFRQLNARRHAKDAAGYVANSRKNSIVQKFCNVAAKKRRNTRSARIKGSASAEIATKGSRVLTIIR